MSRADHFDIKEKMQRRYSYLFEQTVLKFSQRKGHLAPHILCAVSGGVDSMALGYFAKSLLEKKVIKKLTFIHINHQTRSECAFEEKLVRDFAKNHGALFKVFHLEGLSLSQPDFERKASQMRREIFQKIKKSLRNGGEVWSAHHLDDSFEWSLKKRFSSSELMPSSLGMAHKTPLLSRPFLCVSKKQILRYARENQLFWSEDQSNTDPYFERAYLREKVLPPIGKRYPQYLKHYAQNAQKMLDLINLIEEKKSPSRSYLPSVEGHLFHVHFPRDWSCLKARENLKKSLFYFSKKKQGKMGTELKKLEIFIKNGKPGPWSFSGGVKVYQFSGALVVTQGENLEKRMRTPLKLRWEKKSYPGFSKLLIQNLKSQGPLSFWVIHERGSAFKGDHPLLPKGDFSYGFFSAFKLLRIMEKNPSKVFRIGVFGPC